MDREVDERIAPMEGFDFPWPIVPRDLRTTTDDERRGPFAFERSAIAIESRSFQE